MGSHTLLLQDAMPFVLCNSYRTCPCEYSSTHIKMKPKLGSEHLHECVLCSRNLSGCIISILMALGHWSKIINKI